MRLSLYIYLYLSFYIFFCLFLANNRVHNVGRTKTRMVCLQNGDKSSRICVTVSNTGV